ncbi:hypothetical protein E2C01_102724 [Portunus trituberculatus]|uniref:Uncharacterized protein n=1 Tax=Portunus trituberculatus TaxID=210409 RepID=A0A5B7K8Z0_PORTR|nr:hypothetical protein [Portunus trituberculatus]
MLPDTPEAQRIQRHPRRDPLKEDQEQHFIQAFSFFPPLPSWGSVSVCVTLLCPYLVPLPSSLSSLALGSSALTSQRGGAVSRTAERDVLALSLAVALVKGERGTEAAYRQQDEPGIQGHEGRDGEVMGGGAREGWREGSIVECEEERH